LLKPAVAIPASKAETNEHAHEEQIATCVRGKERLKVIHYQKHLGVRLQTDLISAFIVG
jgi:hypothetical protein